MNVGGELSGPYDFAMTTTPQLSSADFIVERPQVGSTPADLVPLLNYQSVTMAGYATLYGSSTVYPINGAPGIYEGLNMVGQVHGDPMATTSAVESDGATFVNTHNNCSW